jgi:hypothetical protein
MQAMSSSNGRSLLDLICWFHLEVFLGITFVLIITNRTDKVIFQLDVSVRLSAKQGNFLSSSLGYWTVGFQIFANHQIKFRNQTNSTKKICDFCNSIFFDQ